MPVVLRPYQLEPFRAIVDSVVKRRGLTFSVMFSRQAGKNELSAQLEVLLLTLYGAQGGEIVKASPTFRPQTINSIERLGRRLNDWGMGGFWAAEHGYMIRLGKARAVFLSAGETANVVGHTASLLLECDEAQDVLPEKWDKDFRPMAASTNATTVLYGTAWDDSTLLERQRQANLEAEQRDGVRRHFEYDWRTVAECNGDYGRYVEAERERLGPDHPLFVTQYELRTLRSGGGFFGDVQLGQLRGEHARQKSATANRVYVAGLDLAGQAEADERAVIETGRIERDSTVLTVGELDLGSVDAVNRVPVCRIVGIWAVAGTRHVELLPQLVDLLTNVWKVRRVCVDATGVGQTIAGMLLDRLGERRVEPFRFGLVSKSELGYGLLGAVNGGRVKMYREDDTDSREWWSQVKAAKSYPMENRLLRWFVPTNVGHDDYLMSTALLARAASEWRDRTAVGGRQKAEGCRQKAEGCKRDGADV